MEVARLKKEISVSQQKHVLDLLKETEMLGSKIANTTMDSTIKLGSENNKKIVDRARYQRLVAKLIYLTHTRPDISFVVNTVIQS